MRLRARQSVTISPGFLDESQLAKTRASASNSGSDFMWDRAPITAAGVNEIADTCPHRWKHADTKPLKARISFFCRVVISDCACPERRERDGMTTRPFVLMSRRHPLRRQSRRVEFCFA